MRSASLLLMSTLLGCAFSPSQPDRAPPDGGGGGEAPGVDAGPPIASPCDAPWSFRPTGFDPCAPGMPPIEDAMELGPGDWRYDTGTGELVGPDQDVRRFAFASLLQEGGVPIHLVSLAALEVGPDAVLIVAGPDPAFFAVHDRVEIDGRVVVEAGTAVDCERGAGRAGEDALGENGAGGGGGGGHSAPGGRAGAGRSAEGGAPGAAVVDGTGVPLRPGCPGGAGGDLLDDDGAALLAPGGAGGRGGGALHLAARDRLRIEGELFASGTGGAGGAPPPDDDDQGGAGGGGGGAGGDLRLEAAVITIPGRVCAGGGSGGPGGSAGRPAEDGTPGGCETALAPELEGSGVGGDGRVDGAGGEGAAAPGSGGGGGGGAAGRVQVDAEGPAVVTGFIAPEPIE